jgi:ATP-binding cassette subfamily C protein CydCD
MDGVLLGLARPVRGRIALGVLLGLLVTAGYAGQGLCLAMALSELLASHAWRGAIPWLAGFVAIVMARSLLIWAAELAAQATGLAVKARIRARLLAKLIDLGPGFALSRRTGELQTTVVSGVEALENYFARYLPAMVVALLGCSAVLAVIAVIDWPTAALLAVFVIAAPFADAIWMRWRMPKSSGIFAALGAFAAYLIDSIQGVVALKAFDAAGRRRSTLVARATELRSASMHGFAVSLFRSGITGLITLGGVGLVLSLNAWRVAAGELAPSVLFLDEAASNLDAENERAFQAALAQVRQGRTVLVIAHRRSTIQAADWIVVLENGKEVEEGRYDQLVTWNDRFTRLIANPGALG